MEENLFNRHRPSRWSQFIGQDSVVRLFRSLVNRNQQTRNIILHGAWGSGKTSGARYWVKCSLCEHPTEGDACNECTSCRKFGRTGREHPALLEFDGASKGRIDEIHKIIDNARMPPIHGNKKFFIVDECQGLSRQAWDALLKIVEEPPEWLCFIFSTTEIDKVRNAVQSRCHLLQVNLLKAEDAVHLLTTICHKEGIPEPDQDALKVIAFISKGHPRDLIKNLDQVLLQGEFDLEIVREVFQLGEIEHLVKTLRAICSLDTVGVSEHLRRWEGDPADKFELICNSLLLLLQKVRRAPKVEIAPTLSLIQNHTIDSIITPMKAIGDPEVILLKGLKFVLGKRVASDLDMDIATLCLIDEMKPEFKNNTTQSGDVARLERRSARKMRVNATREQRIAEATPEQNVPEKTPVYMHTLLRFNFKEVSSTNIQTPEV